MKWPRTQPERRHGRRTPDHEWPIRKPTSGCGGLIVVVCYSCSVQGHEIEQLLTRELSGGERLLWSGRPRQGLMLRSSDTVVIPFSLMWGGFAIFWEATVIKQGGSIFMMFWGIPFVVVGLYMIAGRFFIDARVRRRTAYGVTNERVVIVSGLVKSSVKSLSLRSLADMSLEEREDGSGTITFGPAGTGSMSFAGRGNQQQSPAFEGIANARSVHNTIRQAQKSAV
jgi:hypothetical protein